MLVVLLIWDGIACRAVATVGAPRGSRIAMRTAMFLTLSLRLLGRAPLDPFHDVQKGGGYRVVTARVGPRHKMRSAHTENMVWINMENSFSLIV